MTTVYIILWKVYVASTGRIIELTAIVMVVCSSLRPAIIVLCMRKTLSDAKMLAFDIKVVPIKLYLSISQLYK